MKFPVGSLERERRVVIQMDEVRWAWMRNEDFVHRGDEATARSVR